MKNKMKILINTGVYPPQIGGPAQYAKNLKETFEKMGHDTSVKTYGAEGKLPTGLRHLFFFFKIIPEVLKSDVVFALDTFSVGLPSVLACKIFGKKCIIRTGGDFLWEQYCERTNKKVLLGNFYNTENGFFTLKEKIIFLITKWTLHNSAHIIFSTDWQRKIFTKAYGLNPGKTSVVENYYGNKESDFDYESKIFIASSRKLILKNRDILNKIFVKIKINNPEASLFTDDLPFDEFVKKIARSYAVVCISVGEVSPNIILDAIRLNRPFICTREVGIFERIKDVGIFVDPLNEREIEEAVRNLLTEEGYQKAREKVKNFSFVHTWEEIAQEFLNIQKD
jgi:glycosyltransferase involved in cell wall biosynthesis